MRDKGAQWLRAGRTEPARSPRQRGAFLGPVRFLKRTRGQSMPCGQDGQDGQDAAAGRGLSEAAEHRGRRCEAGLGRRHLLPGPAAMLPDCVHLMWPLRGPSERVSGAEPDGATSTFRHKRSVWCASSPMGETTAAGTCCPASGLVPCLCLVCSAGMLIDLTSQSHSFFI